MRPWQLAIALLCLPFTATGCMSARSTLIHRGEMDMEWEKERLLHGIPITVQVPTHIRVDVYEHRYLGKTNLSADETGALSGGQIAWLDQEAVDVPIRSVHTQLIKTAKIFTVDPKRPAAGTMKTTMTFGGEDGQYFDKISYFVDDKTIEAITGVIKQVAHKGLIGAPTSEAGGSADIDKYLRRVDGIVASGFFSLDAPDVELQVAQFLEHHLNACHSCRLVPPGTTLPSRLPPVMPEPCEYPADGFVIGDQPAGMVGGAAAGVPCPTCPQ